MRGNDYSRVAVAIICSHAQVPEKQHNHQHHEEGGSEPPQLVERGRIAFVESDEGLRGLEGVPLIEKSVTPLYELPSTRNARSVSQSGHDGITVAVNLVVERLPESKDIPRVLSLTWTGACEYSSMVE